MWEQLRIIQGDILKLGGIGKNSNMRGHTKFLGGLKNRGARLSGAGYRGVFYDDFTLNNAIRKRKNLKR